MTRILCVDPLPVKPELHQLNFGFLVGNNFLRKPTHLGVVAIEKFRSRHVNGSLVMRQHQVHEVRIFIEATQLVSCVAMWPIK